MNYPDSKHRTYRKLGHRKLVSRRKFKGGTQPTMASNFDAVKNVALSAATNIVADGIYSVADSLGIDPNKPASETVAQVGNSMENVVNALNSQEGEKLKENASKLLSESIDIVKPSIEKAEDILKDGITKLSETGASAVVAAINEFPPIFLATEASKLGTAVVQAGKVGADLITTGATGLKQLEPPMNNASSLYGQLERLSQNVNNGVSAAITMAETYNNKYGDNIVKRELETLHPDQEQEQETQMNHIIQQGGANNALKNYSKQAKLIGGRIKQSQLDFFTSHVKSSKIVKSRPKRRSKRRKL
jgi:Mor family transcriptional regulator